MTDSRPFRVQKQEVIDAFEESYLRELLSDCGGNVSESARRAGMDRKSFWKLMKRHREAVRTLRARLREQMTMLPDLEPDHDLNPWHGGIDEAPEGYDPFTKGGEGGAAKDGDSAVEPEANIADGNGRLLGERKDGP